jgi:hypothetical protein
MESWFHSLYNAKYSVQSRIQGDLTLFPTIKLEQNILFLAKFSYKYCKQKNTNKSYNIKK